MELLGFLKFIYRAPPPSSVLLSQSIFRIFQLGFDLLMLLFGFIRTRVRDDQGLLKLLDCCPVPQDQWIGVCRPHLKYK